MTKVEIGCYYEVVKPFGKYFTKKGEKLYAWYCGELIMVGEDRREIPYHPSKLIKFIDNGYLKLIIK